MKFKWALCLLFSSFLLFGCREEVITVADIYSEGGEQTGYIEIKNLELKEKETSENSDAILHCVVSIPAGYVESKEIPGMYIHEKSPLDSSNVYYGTSLLDGQGIDYHNLTADSYKRAIESAYEKSGRDKPAVKVNSFEKQELEGFPSYVIRSSFQENGTEIEQLIYLIIADKIYTITYSQAADDELLADFEVSEGKIRLVRK